MEKKNPRRAALRLLRAWEEEDKYVNLLLESPLAAGFSGEDRRFLVALLYGTVERLLTLDYWIAALTGKSADRLAPGTRALLRLGLYQLRFMDGVPDFAAINETVSLAAHRGERSFVNGVLRAATRTPERLAFPQREGDPTAYLSVAYSFPEALVRHFLAAYGEALTEELLSAYNSMDGLTLRVNTKITDRPTLLAALAAAGYEASPTTYSPVGIRLCGGADPKALPSFSTGHFFVQDEASQIASLALGAADASLAIDTCAAPGGKSFGIAMEMKAGRLLSLDLHESKLSLIASGAARLGLSSIEVRAHNGEAPIADLCGRADAVLCDAPCSGLGVLGKKADLRYRAAARLGELPPLQEKILTAASRYVRAGGVLLYSTCTLDARENAGVRDAFLAKNPDFVPEDFAVGALSSTGGELTLLPPLHGTDGFYMAKFRKSG